MIVLDTSVLSVAFRRSKRPSERAPAVERFAELVQTDAPLAVPGIVLQELLSGVKTEAERRKLDHLLGGFPLLLASRETHVRAAEIRSSCRAKGIAASTVDCLIAAHAVLVGAELMTLDDDFARMAPHTGLRLLAI